jgi:hypothetical protein
LQLLLLVMHQIFPFGKGLPLHLVREFGFNALRLHRIRGVLHDMGA